MTEQDLKNYKKFKSEIDTLEDSIRKFENKITNAKVQLPKTSSPGMKMTMEDTIIELEGLKASYATKINALVKKRKKVENAIDKIDDSETRTIFRLRYIDGYEWEDICPRVHLRWSQTHKKHAEAKEKFFKDRTLSDTKS